MKFTVLVTAQAERDLYEIHRYVALHDAPEKADRLLSNLEETVASLETAPQRGHYPPELAQLGVREYREIFFKPYRIIYRVIGCEVAVSCALDGRRDLPDLLQERLLR